MATQSDMNPMGTDGFEFVEYAAPDPKLLRSLFERLGFPVVARHRSKNVTLHSQGDINFVINAEPDSFGQKFARPHGPSVCAMAFRVRDAAAAFERAVSLGAEPHRGSVGPMELNIPAIVGIGGSLIYFVDRYGDRSIYDVDFSAGGAAAARSGPACCRSTTSRTTCIAATWTSGPASTRRCSISARSATSTSKARRPACSRAR